jgi:hypothetical protein
VAIKKAFYCLAPPLSLDRQIRTGGYIFAKIDLSPIVFVSQFNGTGADEIYNCLTSTDLYQ